MRRTLALVVLPLVLLAALAACGSEGSDGGDDGAGAPTGDDLDGRTFVTEGLTLTFADGRLSAQPGCNALGGTYRIEDGRLTVGELAMTEMACEDPALMEADAAFAAFLEAGPTIALDGRTLTLTTADTTWVLTDREVADPDRALAGSWTLTTLIAGDAASSGTVGVSAGVKIEADASTTGSDRTLAAPTRLTWFAGCEIAGAEITVDEAASTVTIGSPLDISDDCTPTATPDDDRRTFEAMSAVLTGTVSYTIDADVLTLANGDRGLQLRASE